MKVFIEKLDNFGRGITYVEDKICFVENTLPGEEVEIEIIKENKKLMEGIVQKYYHLSKSRIKEECPFSSKCGGCHLNHLNYHDENDWKMKKIISIMSKFAGIDEKMIKDIAFSDRDCYRNKITLHGKDGKLGLYEKKTNSIVEIDSCLQVSSKINDMIKTLKKINKNIEEAVIKVSNDESEIMVSIKGQLVHEELLKDCDVLIINGEYRTKRKKIITNIGDFRYYEGIDSFFQVNKTLTNYLFGEAIDVFRNDNPNNVLDLYCGTGTIGIYYSKYCKRVLGIDYNPSNINDAKENAKLNYVDNIEFICDKVENQISNFNDIDIIILDPPRAGLDEKTRNNIKRIASKKIVYISCNPITLARDLKNLKEQYDICYIKPFNMFPRTYHVECISVLERKSVEK